MSTDGLTKDQIAFLEECELEFSDRFTDADLEYKKIYDLGIPPPPIMCPWYGRAKFNNRDRASGSRYNEQHRRDYRNMDDSRRDNSYRDREYSDRRYRPY